MSTCLLGLGSNMGDRQATLRAALAEIEAMPDTWLLRESTFHRTSPLGGPSAQEEFLNAAALVETTVPPLTFLQQLQRVESRHGRERSERWAQRPIDIDLLLYGNEVAETEMLTLPHPRMSFRRFVLQPAAEIAPKLIHPTIGWSIERLLLHLDAASDQVVVLSPSEATREQVVELIASRFGAAPTVRPTFATADPLWPHAVSTWLDFPQAARGPQPGRGKRRALPYAAAAFPKLTILLDARAPAPDAKAEAPGIIPSQWSAIVRKPGRGPTLRLQSSEAATIEAEVEAAIQSVWPDLGPASRNRLE